MRRLPPIKLPLIFLLAAYLFFTWLGTSQAHPGPFTPLPFQTDLKTEAYKILDNKCNVCHRRQNPFMVFNQRNMERRAKKIYTQVFIKKRMPKPEGQALTPLERSTLEKWLLTQNIQ